MSEIKSITTIDGELRSFDRSKLNELEEVLVLRPHYAKPEFEEKVRRMEPGEKYKVKGLDKAEAIMSGFVTLDLKAKIPKTNKRTLADAEISKAQIEANKSSYLDLKKQVDELSTMVKKLIK